jgi:hypothetical protein
MTLFKSRREPVNESTSQPERTLVYEASNTYFLVGLKIHDPAYTLDSMAAGLKAGLLRLENAAGGEASVLVFDAARPEGRAIASGLVDTDHQDVRCRDFWVEELLGSDPDGDAGNCDARH